MQADGRKDLEHGSNRGDPGDCFPGSGGNRSFGKDTQPGSRSYGGLDSGVHLGNIKKRGAGITANLSVSSNPEIFKKGNRKASVRKGKENDSLPARKPSQNGRPGKGIEE